MRITNLEKGEAYQLAEGTKIEVERTNPFFNDYGEQTVPLDLPASEHNRRLLGYPDSFGRREKMQTADVSIQDGEYHAQCRQFVLSATRRGTISTSFYINDGSFYSRIQNVRLKDVFEDEVVEFNGTTVEARITNAIQFCRSLRSGTDERFAIFSILVADDSGMERGYNFKILNAFGKEVTKRFYVRNDSESFGSGNVPYEDVNVFMPDETGAGCDFYNATGRTEYVDEIPISLSPGYYISPFVRTNYVLKKIFRYFGYSLLPNFFTQTSPFTDMVLLNNVIDVLVNGRLKVADLLPDVSIADFLAVFRKKFCCEFSTDEGMRTANIVFLRDVMGNSSITDLTHCLTDEPSIKYKSQKDFKRVILSSKEVLDSDTGDSYEDIKSLVQNNPTAYLDIFTGAFYKEGFSGNYKVLTKVAEASMPYNTGEDTEEQEVEIPDCIPEFRNLMYHGSVDEYDYEQKIGTWLYVGRYATLNSKMAITGDDEKEDSENTSRMLPMLAFAYMSGGTKPAGTISPYDLQNTTRDSFGGSRNTVNMTKLFDYALYYYGPDGIFERFWRDCDTLHRNALQETKMRLLLSQSQKQNLKAWGKVSIRGMSFFFNKLKFTLGGKDEPIESELLTTGLTEPTIHAEYTTELLPRMATDYMWTGLRLEEEVTEQEYNNSGVDKERTFHIIYPPLPSEEWVNKKYAEQISYTAQKTRHATFFRHSRWKYTKTTVWLTAVPASSQQHYGGRR